MAAKATAKLMRVLKSDNAGFAEEWKAICDRRSDTVLDVEREVARIIADVRAGGDEALFAFVKKFDGAKLDKLEVTKQEWDEACDRVAPRRPRGARQGRDARARVPPQADPLELGGARRGRRLHGPPRAAARARRALRARRQGGLSVDRDHERGAGLGGRGARDHDGDAAAARRARSAPRC